MTAPIPPGWQCSAQEVRQHGHHAIRIIADYFLYDGDRTLAYRGAFDTSRPRSEVPVTGELLRAAVNHVLRGQAIPLPHTPSIGCGVK